MLGVDLQDYCEYDYRDNLDYLTFYCDEAGTIGWKCTDASVAKTIQYSKDFGATWTNLTSTTSGATVAVNAGDIVWFKGTNSAYGSVMYSNCFTLSNKAHVYGNVNSLTGNSTSVSKYCFKYLFKNCSNLYIYESKKIILPATTLANYCYSYMFYGCSSLTTAPELPATTLAESCYGGMFNGCTSLTSAPELPATTLADYCYNYMFYGCSSLTTAPELPATTLMSDCYNYMFQGCTSLTTAPELPATTLAYGCYQGMFQGCTSLTTAPELPATTLTSASGCYRQMFQNCSSLNYIKALFTTDPSSGSYTTNWVSGVAPTGTFVKSVAATWDVTGNNGVPTGWTTKIDDNRSDPNLSITLDDVNLNSSAVVCSINTPDEFTGELVVDIDSWYHGTAVPEDGRADIVVPIINSNTGEYLNVGSHTVVVQFDGDAQYKPEVVTSTFNVGKLEAGILVDAFADGDVLILDIKLIDTRDLVSSVIVDVDGVLYGLNITDGKGQIVIPGCAGGDHFFTVSINSEICEADPVSESVNVSDVPIYGFEVELIGTTLKVQLPIDDTYVTGDISVEVQGSTYTVQINNPIALFDLSEIPSGDHQVTITYTGDDKYASHTEVQTITIP